MFPPPAPPAGTQIVVHAPVLGSHGAVVHPRGAVGVITRTPVTGESHFLLRFPDGFETSLPRGEFDILREFRARLGQAGTDPPAGALGFDLESLVLLRCVIGSRAYGLETEASDTDRRGVYLAPPDLEWSLFGAPEQFEDSDGQWCLWELKKFLVMAPNCQRVPDCRPAEKCPGLASHDPSTPCITPGDISRSRLGLQAVLFWPEQLFFPGDGLTAHPE